MQVLGCKKIHEVHTYRTRNMEAARQKRAVLYPRVIWSLQYSWISCPLSDDIETCRDGSWDRVKIKGLASGFYALPVLLLYGSVCFIQSLLKLFHWNFLINLRLLWAKQSIFLYMCWLWVSLWHFHIIMQCTLSLLGFMVISDMREKYVVFSQLAYFTQNNESQFHLFPCRLYNTWRKLYCAYIADFLYPSLSWGLLSLLLILASQFLYFSVYSWKL